VNATARKFGHPDSLVLDAQRWCVLLRPAQITLGSLVLVCKDPARRLGEIGELASAELRVVAAAIEAALSAAFRNDKLNYLMLMMVDPDVHFHVLPRYASPRSFAGETFADAFWPGPPDLRTSLELSPAVRAALLAELRKRFAARP
jgi:diadenosine tetraphosphate (Ap4A) HIT family hydrolase